MYNYIRISVHTVFVHNMGFKDNIWIFVCQKQNNFLCFPNNIEVHCPLDSLEKKNNLPCRTDKSRTLKKIFEEKTGKKLVSLSHIMNI